ncbi:alanine racemase [Microbacterium ulmi]|uniref:Alanine racemase n=1 Tax=Microbacterium ulmi TaxID=179095 RepID=A0A7Y2Q0I6_9MICO|nr:alanine racemase [Microbacterium ulmi]NII70280.1 alanine racemase [Microbacterium ulmi]NNH03327.1 alanine racemase [Microbacterium ulmi]
MVTKPQSTVRSRATTGAPSRLVVSRDAIAENTRRMRALASTPLMAVVKADGFGLGAGVVARAALAGGASELGVATCDEALALRADGIEAPVLAWMLHPGAPLADAVGADVALSCASVDQLEAVAAAASSLGVTAAVELEVETGMHRSGCPVEEWGPLVRAAVAAERCNGVDVRGVWTHFGATDDDPTSFADPLLRLDAAWATARALGLRPRRRHAASSLATAIAPAARLGLVRVGAALFGIEPVAARPLGLAPSIRWETSVAQLRDVPAGASVGYGGGYRTSRRGRLALLPLGYADGIPRSAWPGSTVVIRGRRHPLVGAVSMDQCVVDVGDAGVGVGDEVVLIGEASRGEPTLAEWAMLLGTIPQEVLTRIGARVERVSDGRAA